MQTRTFANNKKKLHKNQIKEFDDTVRMILKNPEVGEQKKGDLKNIYIYKCKITKQLFLITYQFNDETITLLMAGPHENFYRNLRLIPQEKP